jgi:hypothetical protein
MEGMVNIISLKTQCLEETCVTIPYFNFPGEKKALYCSKHKKDGMVNVRDKHCENEGGGCYKIPLFNYPGFKHGIFCSIHKMEGMVSIKKNIISIKL